MHPLATLDFTQNDLPDALLTLDRDGLDALEFGVIGFDAATIVRDYNACESRMAGLSRERVIGLPLFTAVAICMNNVMVAHRFEEAAETGVALDVTIDYVLTLRMRPQRVQLRLLAWPGEARRFVLIQRKTGA
ncbi:phosphonate transporter [uncultured Sphaerotilus sp.]|uniref:phosphonate transporter n=1 Tax=uncultured Sphaerotilus sp. TaxID=474984 RepID=UPI0030CA265A